MEKVFFLVARIFLIMVMVTFGAGMVGVVAISGVKNPINDSSIAKSVNAGERVMVTAENSGSQITASVRTEIVAQDAREEIIRRYLEKYKSPLLPYTQLIKQLSDQYGFEYYWIIAIGQQESNLCKKIPENSHNCWGYGIHSRGTLRFDSYELALQSYAEYLKRGYFDKGLNTPELIMKKYCPHSPEGAWAKAVGHIIGEIESGSF